MSPAISFSALEILPALLDRSKTQTIRPLFFDPLFLHDEKDKFSKQEFHAKVYDAWTVEPRLKVGDKVKLYWKMRSKAKWFHRSNGKEATKQEISEFNNAKCSCGKSVIECSWCTDPSIGFFPKLLGEVRITDVFEIEMKKSGEDFLLDIENPISKIHKLGERFLERFNPIKIAEEMPKRDGFKSAEEMFEWFDKQYDLSTPKRFAVYRWKWL